MDNAIAQQLPERLKAVGFGRTLCVCVCVSKFPNLPKVGSLKFLWNPLIRVPHSERSNGFSFHLSLPMSKQRRSMVVFVSPVESVEGGRWPFRQNSFQGSQYVVHFPTP